MNLEIAVFVLAQKLAKIFESLPTAVHSGVFSGDKELSQVKVLLHEEGYVDGSYCEKEAGLVLLHDLHQGLVPLSEAQDHLERQNTASPEICLGALALKPQTHPFLA